MFIPAHPQNFTMSVGDLPMTFSYLAGKTRVTFHDGDTSVAEPMTRQLTGIPVAVEFNHSDSMFWVLALTRTTEGGHLAHLFCMTSEEHTESLGIQTQVRSWDIEEHLVKLSYNPHDDTITVSRSDNGIIWNAVSTVPVPPTDE